MATETSATGRTAERDAPRGGSPPGPPADGALTEIATALFHLRRVWAKPDLVKRVRAQTSAATDGRPLQLSNLMVVNAVAALTACERPDACSCEVTVGAVAERLEIDPSTASRLVGHAIDAGLVSRRPSPVDARRANLGLTEPGRRVKQVADRFRRAYLDDLMTDWSERERTEFARLLTRFADAAVRAPMYPDGIDRIFEEAAAD
ncbi:MarR family winged helix-turn-helix transcriptional regulator [Actinomadura mexicana]|uniref:DNA-binding transcriptional regulator, MarR family n=1 Tax=Actinomadura mexicana TaxID=134959 RepID=A0A239AK22_9ACTN|nr:MarR family transcriptional regulator [Actinomadura mexicana]SNR95731.1 DNA-binding transcriptional regulator, MarR family [Actinomadura mexicana]